MNPTYGQGFLDGISWVLLQQAMNQRRVLPLLKPNEKIVCSYATVTVDKFDNWSWWRNNRELVVRDVDSDCWDEDHQLYISEEVVCMVGVTQRGYCVITDGGGCMMPLGEEAFLTEPEANSALERQGE